MSMWAEGEQKKIMLHRLGENMKEAKSFYVVIFETKSFASKLGIGLGRVESFNAP